MIMNKTNLLFATLIVGLVAAGGEDKTFLEKIAMGPYQEGSSRVHSEPGDNATGPVISNIAVIPNVPVGAPITNDDLRKQLVDKASNDATQWLTNESTLKTYTRYKKNPREEEAFDQETEDDTFDAKTAVNSKKFYIRGQKKGRHVRKYRVDSYAPRKRSLRRAHRHRRSRSDASKSKDGSCTEDYKHCRRRHDRYGNHVGRSGRSRSVDSSRSRSSHGRRSRSLSSTRDSRDRSRSRDRSLSRSRRDRSRSHARSRRDRSRGRHSRGRHSHGHRHRSRRDRSRSRSDSRDRNRRSRGYNSGSYGAYHNGYGSINNNFTASDNGLYAA